MSEQDPEVHTYRGRSLEDLVGRIRDDLGDDAVIVARRETRSGGFAGFFAKREIEVDVRPAVFVDPGPEGEIALLGQPQGGTPDPDESPAARAFREQLEQAQVRAAQSDVVSDDYAGPESAADVDVHDLFPKDAPDSGFREIFEPAEGASETASDWNAAGDADVIPISARTDWTPPTAEEGFSRYEQELSDVLDADLEGASHAEPEAEPQTYAAAELADGPVQARRLTLPPSPAPVSAPPGAPAGQAAAIARRAAERMVERGLREDLAVRVSAEAVSGLLPFHPHADVRELVARALAQHLPTAPLRTGPVTAAFVGSGGSGKTRCAARLAAAYSRSGDIPVTVVALRSSDHGAELQRLLAPYEVQLVAADDGDTAATELAMGSQGMVLIDTPAIVLRNEADRRDLIADLAALRPDEVHVTLPATMSGAAASELLDALIEAEPVGMTVTHCDETFKLGTMLGLSVERGLPISYMSKGQAVDAGLDPIAGEALAAELLC